MQKWLRHSAPRRSRGVKASPFEDEMDAKKFKFSPPGPRPTDFLYSARTVYGVWPICCSQRGKVTFWQWAPYQVGTKGSHEDLSRGVPMFCSKTGLVQKEHILSLPTCVSQAQLRGKGEVFFLSSTCRIWLTRCAWPEEYVTKSWLVLLQMSDAGRGSPLIALGMYSMAARLRLT